METKSKQKLSIIIAICCSLIACVTVLVCIHYFTEENKYNTAQQYLEKNNLHIEGFDKSDIKAIYNDIISDKFENPKTEAFIRKNITVTKNVVYPVDEKLTKEQMKLYLLSQCPELKEKDIINHVTKGNITYGVLITNDVGKTLVKREKGNTVWSIKVDTEPEMYSEWHPVIINDGVIFYSTNGKIMKLSESGEVIKEINVKECYADKFTLYDIITVIPYENGDFDVVGYRNSEKYIINNNDIGCVLPRMRVSSNVMDQMYHGTIFIAKFDKAGNELSCTATYMGKNHVQNVIATDKGYIIISGGNEKGEYIYITDKSGNLITDDYGITLTKQLNTVGYTYHIKDIKYADGKLYISADIEPDISTVREKKYSEIYWDLIELAVNNSSDIPAITKIKDYMSKHCVYCSDCGPDCLKKDDEGNYVCKKYRCWCSGYLNSETKVTNYTLEFLCQVLRASNVAALYVCDAETLQITDSRLIEAAYADTVNVWSDGKISWDVDCVSMLSEQNPTEHHPERTDKAIYSSARAWADTCRLHYTLDSKLNIIDMGVLYKSTTSVEYIRERYPAVDPDDRYILFY